jgi:hypothetical protein
VDEFQKCQCVSTNAGTEVHHPNIDTSPQTALSVPTSIAAQVTFGNGYACLMVTHQAFADAVRGVALMRIQGFAQKPYEALNSLNTAVDPANFIAGSSC